MKIKPKKKQPKKPIKTDKRKLQPKIEIQEEEKEKEKPTTEAARPEEKKKIKIWLLSNIIDHDSNG